MNQTADRQKRLRDTLREVAPGLDTFDIAQVARALSLIDLDAFQALWDRRKADFPDHLPVVEGRIISKVLDAALAQEDVQIALYWEYLGSSDDGPEEGVTWTRDRSRLEAETGATGLTFYRFRRFDADGETRRLGWVMFVHGNHTDVLSDYTNNEWTIDVVADANAMADTLSGGC